MLSKIVQESVPLFWKKLEDYRFIQSTDSITGEITEIDGGIEDMEAVVRINGEFDKHDIDSLIISSQISLLEAELERKKGMMKDDSFWTKEMTAEERLLSSVYSKGEYLCKEYVDGFNQAIQEDIKYLTEQIEIIKKTNL